MASANSSIVFSLVTGSISLLVLLYVSRKQFYEVLLPSDGLTRLRWIILIMLVVSIIGIVPVLAYQTLRLMGTDSDTLRNIAAITGNLSRLASALLLLMVYHYRLKKK